MTKRARKACELKMGDIVVGSVVVGSGSVVIFDILEPLLFKNIVHVGSFKHFVFV